MSLVLFNNHTNLIPNLDYNENVPDEFSVDNRENVYINILNSATQTFDHNPKATFNAKVISFMDTTLKITTPLHLACISNDIEGLRGLLCGRVMRSIINMPNESNLTPVYIAAEYGHIECLMLLIENNANLNALPGFKNNAPLLIAIQNGHKECAKILMENGANPNILDDKGQTPIHLACKIGLCTVTRALITKNVDLNFQTYKIKNTPLLTALKKGYKKSVKMLLEASADATTKDYKGRTPLHIACEKGLSDITELLIAYKATLNDQVTYSGDTALMLAVINGFTDCANILIENGADLDIQNYAGLTALHIACREGNDTLVKSLISKKAQLNSRSYSDNETPLLIATRNGKSECAKLLIEDNADLDIPNYDGWAPLHFACQNGMEGVVKMLAYNNANLNLQTFSTKATALHIAVELGKIKFAEFLIKRGTYLTLKNSQGSNPLHIACNKNYYDLARMLTNSYTLNAQNLRGETPLFIAVECDSKECIQLLLDCAADINLSDNTKTTPLHIACKSNMYHTAKLLLENGAILDAQDINNNTPLINALRNGSKETAHLLINNGANVNLAGENKYSPVHYACMQGWKDTLYLLISKGANLEATTVAGDTILHLSLSNSQENIAQFLIEHNLHVDTANNYLVKPIHVACDTGLVNIVKLLIGRTALNVSDYAGITPLHLSIKNKHEDCTRVLLKNGVSLTDVRDKTGNSHFSLLLRHLDLQFHRSLVINDLSTIDVKKSDSLGNTALHYAIYHNDPEIMGLILERIEMKDNISKNIYYETPWMMKAGQSKLIDDLKDEERALLDMNDEYLRNFGLSHSTEEFNSIIETFCKIYGSESHDFLFNILYRYKIDTKHLSYGVEKIPEKSISIDLDGYLSLYDKLISTPSASIIPDEIRDRRTLENLLNKIKNRTAYSGTPRSGNREELEQFYRPIDSALSYVLESLQSQKDERVQLETLRTLLTEGNMCGGKVSVMSSELYYKVCLGKAIDLKHMIYSKLAKIREYLIDSSIPRHPQNVHDRNLIMYELGIELGIPGGEEARIFKDPYTGHGVDIDRIRRGFFRRYTPYTIADALRKEINEDSDFKDKFLEFVVEKAKRHSCWNVAFKELVETDGNLSLNTLTNSIQKKIIETIQVIDPCESIEWKKINTEEEMDNIFCAYQKMNIDIQVILFVLSNHDIITY